MKKLKTNFNFDKNKMEWVQKKHADIWKHKQKRRNKN